MYETLGGKPAHNTLAYHWARLVEILYAAERMVELLDDDDIMSDNIRTLPTEKPTEGIGVVEAPRGTLIHHYKTDERGVITQANLIVATVNNAAAICMSVERAAKGLIKDGKSSTTGFSTWSRWRSGPTTRASGARRTRCRARCRSWSRSRTRRVVSSRGSRSSSMDRPEARNQS